MPMYLKKCPYCKSSDVKKNGLRNHIQHYKCKCCGKQFLGKSKPSIDTVWNEYLNAKQTIAEIAVKYHLSESTVKRLLRKKTEAWTQPVLSGMSGFVHLDATYWGHNCGIMLCLDSKSSKVLYLEFIKHETTKSYMIAVESIIEAGYLIKGIIVDGKKELFTVLNDYPIQMCQFHMIQIVRRYLTQNPRMNASREVLSLVRAITTLEKADFENCYYAWKERYNDFLSKRTTHKDGTTCYLHRRVRTVMNSIDFFLPYLFTFQRSECAGMPNTNNKIEGTFADLKKNLNNHSGLTAEHRRQFIIAYFRDKP